MEAYSNPPPDHQKSFYSSLHSIQSSNHHKHKSYLNKKLHISPLPPNPPKVYKVHPINFKEFVQRLTGASAAGQPPRMRNMAPPLQQFLPRSETEDDGEDNEDAQLTESPFSGMYRELMTSETTTAATLNDNNVMMTRPEDSNYYYNYYYNNARESLVNSSSLDLNLASTTSSQQCWYSSEL
ncbi:hypothetical protein LINPERPRIM_LOCUS3854 [Linum perenne]